jgi:DNA-binding transcriptional MerR regulator
LTEGTIRISTDQLLAAIDDPEVTARTLEYWRQQGLLPKAQRTGQVGKRPEWSYPAAALDQLQELLRLRQRSRQPDVLRAALWFRGFPVETGGARSSIIAVLQRLHRLMLNEVDKRRDPSLPEEDARCGALEQIGRTVARKRGKHAAPRVSRQKLEDRERATTLLLGLGLGYPEAVERLGKDGALAERLIGVDQGRRSFAGLNAWLSGPAGEGLEAYGSIGSLPALIDAVSSATDDELLASRERGRTMLGGIAAVSRMADALALGDNVTGLGVWEAVEHDPMASVWLTAFVVSIGRISEYDANLRSIVEAIGQSVTPIEEQMRSLAELPPNELDRRLEPLPFIQQAQAKRLIAGHRGDDEAATSRSEDEQP